MKQQALWEEDEHMAQDWLRFEEFLWESFCDGQTRRELRLSEEELSILRLHYPEATCHTDNIPSPDGKCWYTISLSPCIAKAI